MIWVEDLSTALEARDSVEQSARGIIIKYARLADRTSLQANATRSNETALSETSSRRATDTTSRQAQELIEAQRQRAELEIRVSRLDADLEHRRDRSSHDSKRISDLVSEKKGLAVRLKDLEEEIRGKAKLLEDVHDDIVALTLQLNILEEKNNKLEEENHDLVDRWMARMGQEAEAMNRASEFN